MENHTLPNACPFCNGALIATELFCTGCDTRIQGRFAPNRLFSLDADDLEFLLTFIGCRGNIKDVEQTLGISYPTVRSRLDRLIKNLALRPAKQNDTNRETLSEERNELLNRIETGELSVSQALSKLKKKQNEV